MAGFISIASAADQCLPLVLPELLKLLTHLGGRPVHGRPCLEKACILESLGGKLTGSVCSDWLDVRDDLDPTMLLGPFGLLEVMPMAPEQQVPEIRELL